MVSGWGALSFSFSSMRPRRLALPWAYSVYGNKTVFFRYMAYLVIQGTVPANTLRA